MKYIESFAGLISKAIKRVVSGTGDFEELLFIEFDGGFYTFLIGGDWGVSLSPKAADYMISAQVEFGIITEHDRAVAELDARLERLELEIKDCKQARLGLVKGRADKE